MTIRQLDILSLWTCSGNVRLRLWLLGIIEYKKRSWVQINKVLHYNMDVVFLSIKFIKLQINTAILLFVLIGNCLFDTAYFSHIKFAYDKFSYNKSFLLIACSLGKLLYCYLLYQKFFGKLVSEIRLPRIGFVTLCKISIIKFWINVIFLIN